MLNWCSCYFPPEREQTGPKAMGPAVLAPAALRNCLSSPTIKDLFCQKGPRADLGLGIVSIWAVLKIWGGM